MGLSQVKILQTCYFVLTNSGKQKIPIIFVFCITKFRHMFVHSAQTQGAMLELKSRKKKFQYFFGFS